MQTSIILSVGGCFCTYMLSQIIQLERQWSIDCAAVNCCGCCLDECKAQTKQGERLVDLFNLGAKGYGIRPWSLLSYLPCRVLSLYNMSRQCNSELTALIR